MSATPANDMKPLHVEGGELLRDRTKDNNTPSVLGPFIRLFDGNFSLNDVRKIGICRRIQGINCYGLEGQRLMGEINRDLEDFIGHCIGANH